MQANVKLNAQGNPEMSATSERSENTSTTGMNAFVTKTETSLDVNLELVGKCGADKVSDFQILTETTTNGGKVKLTNELHQTTVEVGFNAAGEMEIFVGENKEITVNASGEAVINRD